MCSFKFQVYKLRREGGRAGVQKGQGVVKNNLTYKAQATQTKCDLLWLLKNSESNNNSSFSISMYNDCQVGTQLFVETSRI